MGLGCVEPAGGVIVAQPLGDKNRMICSAIRFGEHAIHCVGSFPRVVIIDALDTGKAGILFFGAKNVLIRERQCAAESGVGASNAIHMPIEMILHRVAAVLQVGGKLIQPLISTAIRPPSRDHVECYGRDGPASSQKPAHASFGKNASTETVASGPRM